MQNRKVINDLHVDELLVDFVANEATQGLDISAEQFWQACSNILSKHALTNKELLAKRDALQKQIDEFSIYDDSILDVISNHISS